MRLICYRTCNVYLHTVFRMCAFCTNRSPLINSNVKTAFVDTRLRPGVTVPLVVGWPTRAKRDVIHITGST